MTDQSVFGVVLRDKVSAPSRKAKRGIDDLGRSMRKTEKSAKGLDKAMGGRKRGKDGRLREADGRFVGGGGGRGKGGGGGLFGAVLGGNIASAAIVSVTQGIAAAATEMVTFKQNSRLAFDQLAKHGDTGGQLMELSSILARRFGMDVLDTTHAMQKLLAAQFNPELATDIIKMGADLRTVGANAEDTKGAIRAITQIKGTGILQGDELNQLANAGVSIDLIRQEIGKLLGGKTNLEVLKLQEAGKIDADTAIGGILNAVKRKTGERKLGEAGERFANNTIAGLMGRFKAFAQEVGLDILDRVIAPLTRSATGALDKFFAFVQSEEGIASINRIAASLGDAAKFGADLVGVFGGSFSDTWREITTGFGVMSSAVTGSDGQLTKSTLMSIAKSLGEITAVAVGFGVAFAATAGIIASATGLIYNNFKAILNGVVQTFGDAYLGIVKWFEDIASIWDGPLMKDFVWKVTQTGYQIVAGLAQGILSAIDLPFAAMRNVSSNLLGSIVDFFDIHSPSRVMEGLGGHVAAGFAAGIDGNAYRARGSAQRMTGNTLGGVARHMSGNEYSSMRSAPSFDGAALRGGSISVSLHTEVHGAGGDADETATKSAQASRRMLEDFFRGMAEET